MPCSASALGKAAEMATKPALEPSESPVPGVIPEAIRVHDDGVARPRATTEPGPSPRRRGPASRLLARLVGVVRGDKHMADAYPPPKER
jgi:hypothetical protein